MTSQMRMSHFVPSPTDDALLWLHAIELVPPGWIGSGSLAGRRQRHAVGSSGIAIGRPSHSSATQA